MSSEPTEHDVDPSETLAALHDFVGHPVFKRMWAQVKGEWGPEGYGRKVQAAIAKITPGPDRPYEIAKVTDEIGSMAVAVNEIMEWPAREIRRLTPEPKSRQPFAGLRRIAR